MNPYQPFLAQFFYSLNELRLRSSHFQSTLEQSRKSYANLKKFNINTITGVALVISDWSGPTDQGWRIVHHSGVVNSITLDNYEEELKKMLSFQCSYTLSQCYERLCSLFKDYVMQRSLIDPSILLYKNKNNEIESYSRMTLPGGDKLYSLIKRASGKTFATFSEKNNSNVKYKQFWEIVSEVRHTVTHANSIVNKKKLFGKDEYKERLFRHLFPRSEVRLDDVVVFIDYKDLQKLTDTLAEFAFQIFKSLSIQEKLEWDYFIRKENSAPKVTIALEKDMKSK